MSEKALQAARSAFHRSHSSVTTCLEKAIRAYNSSVMEEFFRNGRKLQVQMATTESGPSTAVVILGFANETEAEAFISELLNENRK